MDVFVGIGVATLLTGTLATSASAARPFDAVASVSPQVQYLDDSAGTTFTFTVANTGTADSIGAVEISRPGKLWRIIACPSAPAGWSSQRADTFCRFRSEAGTADDLAPGAVTSAFEVTATFPPGTQDVSGVWSVKVSRSSNFDTKSKLLAAASDPPGLDTTAYSFQVLDAVVDPAVTTPGAACPTPSKSAITGSTGHTIVVCGRNRTTGTLTPTAARSTLGGTFLASHGGFSSGAVAPTAASVILGSWSSVTITGTAGPDKTVTATIGSSSSRTSPLTTLTGYEALNNPPVATDDTPSTDEDTAASFDPRSNDSDPDGDAILISATDTTGTVGTVTITGSGTGLTYDPNGAFEHLAAGVSTTDTFTYTITDLFGATDTATVMVTVTGVDDLPVAVNDAPAVLEDASATPVDVLANDTDVDAGPISVASVTQPASGAVVITGGGTGLTYAPAANYCNSPPGTTPDTFTYTLNGGSTATVSVMVTCVDDAPSAVDDSATVAEDASATVVDVLANDTDVDAGPISITSVTQPANGTVVITGGGTGLTYAPAANYCNTPPGTTPDTFTYTLNGGSTATVSVTVTCADDAPSAVDDSATVAEDASATPVDVLANDTDVDGGSKLVASVTQPANGTVVITGGGTGLTYAPAANYCNDPPGTAPDTFTYTLSPGGSSATVSITVTCVDDAPTAVDDSATVAEDASATVVDVLANDTDVDAGPISITSVTQPANGTVVITGGGTGLTYAPAANYCNDPPGTAPDTFTYTLNSGSTATVSVTVTCIDDLPVAVDDSATVQLNASATVVDVLANDTDVDAGPISITSVTQPANGTVEITGGGTGLTYAPDTGYCDSDTPDTFTYTLNGGSTATVSVTVACDSPPVAVDDSATVAEDALATAVDVLANDTDVDAGPISITSVTQPANGTVVITGGGTGLTYAPAANYCNDPPGTAPDTFTYTLSPGGSSATVSITVTCVDDAPTAVDDSSTVLEDASATAVDVLANDTDIDAGAKTVASVTQPANGTVVITGGGTGLTYAPAANYCNDPPGTTPDTFTYTLSPGGSTGTVSVTVTCVNDAPVATADSFSVVGNTGLFVGTTRPAGQAGKVITGSVLTNDTDVDSPHASLVVELVTDGPTTLGGTVTIEADGTFTYHPDDGDAGVTDTFTYRVCDATPCTSTTDANATGTLNLPISSVNQVWYVENDAAPGGDGTSDTPFDTLAEAETAASNGDTTYVFDGDNTSTNLNSGFVMAVGERLLGEAVDLQFGADLLYAGVAANRPTLTAVNEDVVTMGSGSRVSGLRIDPEGAGGGIFATAGAIGVTNTISDVRVIDTGTAGTQPGLELNEVDGNYNISDLVVDNSAATGQTAGSIGVRLNDSVIAPTVNFASTGTISITTKGAKALDVVGVNMGSGSVFDDITVTGSGTGGISMLNSVGSGTAFGDGTGVDLALATTGGNAFSLQGTGSVSVPAGGTANVNATAGSAVFVNGSPGSSLAFDDVTVVNNPSGHGIVLTALGTGTFSATSGSISSVSGTAFVAGSGSGAITYPGLISNGSGRSVEVNGRTGGTVTLSGDIVDSGDLGGGIFVTGNSGGSTVISGATKTLSTQTEKGLEFSSSDGHTLTFSGGGLTVATSSGNGIEATSSGTLNITGAGNTVDTGAGRALTVSNTDVGATPLTFVRISSNGTGGGILLSNTGANPALTVASSGAGTCTAADQSGCTGGTIQNSTGVDDATATPVGTGIVLNNTRGVSLTRMYVHDHSNYGIRGTSVVGFAMANSVISGVNGTSALTANKDGSVRFEELTGTVSMTNVAISGGYFTNLMVDNTAGILNGTFDNVDSGTLNATGGDDAVQFEGIGTSTMTVDYKNSAITTASGDLFQYIGDGTGGGNLDLTNNAFTNNEPSISTGGGGIALVAGAKGPATMDVLNNTMRDSLTNALTIIKSRDNAAGTNNLVANITGNLIGLAGTANSGSSDGDGMEISTFGDGNATFNVTNNDVRQYNSSAFQFVAGSGVADSGQFNVNFSGNTAANPGTNPLITLLQGVRVDSGVDAGDTFATCVAFGPNFIHNSSDAANKDFRLVASQSTTIRQPGYTPGATDGVAFAAYAASLIGNSASGTAVANSPATFTGGPGTTCP